MIYCCHECGGAFSRTEDGITQHLDDNGDPDYDTDLDHVPFSLEEEEALAGCECDNTHAQNDTVCRWCWERGRRPPTDPDILA